jgi:DNA polymerase III epsilon subunit-like protein
MNDFASIGVFCCAVAAIFCAHFFVGRRKAQRIASNIRNLEDGISTKETHILLSKAELRASSGRWNAASGRFCSVDVETTGLKRASSRVIQVGLCLFDNGKINGTRVWWIDPGVRIPISATKVNNIRDEDVRGKGDFRHHAEVLQRLLTRYPLVGHNLYFDVTMLMAEFERIDQFIEVRPLYCTMRDVWYRAATEPPKPMAQRGQAGLPRWQKLGDLAASLGVSVDGPLHDALFDARLAGECFIARARLAVGRSEEALQRSESELLSLRSQLHAAQAELKRLKGKVW